MATSNSAMMSKPVNVRFIALVGKDLNFSIFDPKKPIQIYKKTVGIGR